MLALHPIDPVLVFPDRSGRANNDEFATVQASGFSLSHRGMFSYSTKLVSRVCLFGLRIRQSVTVARRILTHINFGGARDASLAAGGRRPERASSGDPRRRASAAGSPADVGWPSDPGEAQSCAHHAVPDQDARARDAALRITARFAFIATASATGRPDRAEDADPRLIALCLAEVGLSAAVFHLVVGAVAGWAIASAILFGWLL